jgi:hypothetical protein
LSYKYFHIWYFLKFEQFFNLNIYKI